MSTPGSTSMTCSDGSCLTRSTASGSFFPVSGNLSQRRLEPSFPFRLSSGKGPCFSSHVKEHRGTFSSLAALIIARYRQSTRIGSSDAYVVPILPCFLQKVPFSRDLRHVQFLLAASSSCWPHKRVSLDSAVLQ